MATRLLARTLRHARAIHLVASSFSRPLPAAVLRPYTWRRTLVSAIASPAPHSHQHNHDDGASSSSSSSSSSSHQQQSDSTRTRHWKYSSLAGASLAAAGYLAYLRQAHAESPTADSSKSHAPSAIVPGEENPTLPFYSKEDIAKHTSPDVGGIWVVYKSGVYDITQFVEEHPGGSERIMLAAGGSIEPFWMLYTVHNNPEVWEVLESKRIGNVRVEDREYFAPKATAATEGPYANDPARHAALIVLSSTPFNGEPPRALLGSSFITPTSVFFTRNHLPVPDVDPETYSLEISIEAADGSVKRLNLQDLKSKFEHHTITATLQCAGNRRGELNQYKPIKGLAWDVGAISTAEWRGVRLSDVLAYCGVTEDSASAHKLQHIQFEGLDRDATTCYGASIPISVALNPQRDVLLAFEMNGEPLTRDHGFPVRVVVPGIVAARNVKWLGRIIASSNESPNHWQQRDYKSFSPNIDWHNVDWCSAPAIQEMPLQSAITSPGPNAKITADLGTSDIEVTVRGYAWSGGGRNIARVDVSADNGQSWHTAELNPDAGATQPYNKAWAWTLWESTFSLPTAVAAAVATSGATEVTLLCRAVDSAYNSQPERGETIWNLRGVVNNQWHRVPVRVTIPQPSPTPTPAN